MIECPLHQGTFNVKTGAAVGAPCATPIRSYPAKREGDRIYVGVEA